MNIAEMIVTGVLGGAPAQFTYRVAVADLQATTPKFTFGAGTPAAVVDWGDGSALEAVTSGTELNHAYAVGGTYTVKLIAPNQATYLTEIDINSDKVVSVLTSIQMFSELTEFWAYSNSLWAQNVTNWQLLSKMTKIYMGSASMIGSVSSWAIPATLLVYAMSDNTLSGVPILASMRDIITLEAHYCALPQASVDLWLSRCVAREAATTYATPTLNLGGTNAAPSAQGLADKATLVGLGWIVTTN